jgi:hypothetical protein
MLAFLQSCGILNSDGKEQVKELEHSTISTGGDYADSDKNGDPCGGDSLTASRALEPFLAPDASM